MLPCLGEPTCISQSAPVLSSPTPHQDAHPKRKVLDSIVVTSGLSTPGGPRTPPIALPVGPEQHGCHCNGENTCSEPLEQSSRSDIYSPLDGRTSLALISQQEVPSRLGSAGILQSLRASLGGEGYRRDSGPWPVGRYLLLFISLALLLSDREAGWG